MIDTVQQTMVLAQGLTPNSGTGLREIILGILGTLLIVVIAFRCFAAFTEERYGKMLGIIAAGIVVAGFVYFPSQAVGIFKGLWGAFV